jgi:hypothetical protein
LFVTVDFPKANGGGQQIDHIDLVENYRTGAGTLSGPRSTLINRSVKTWSVRYAIIQSGTGAQLSASKPQNRAISVAAQTPAVTTKSPSGGRVAPFHLCFRV